MKTLRTTDPAAAFNWIMLRQAEGYELFQVTHRYEWWTWRFVYVYTITMKLPDPTLSAVWGPVDELPNPPDPHGV